MSSETREKISVGKIGEKNPMWAKLPHYTSLHEWVRNNKEKTGVCEGCLESFEFRKLDLALKGNTYSRNVNDYEWLCRKCHMKKDGRLDFLCGRGTYDGSSGRKAYEKKRVII